MKRIEEQLVGGRKVPQFKPVARYERGIDHLVYVTEDVSYRADRVDDLLTVLLHPTEDRIVGVKLKGFRYLFERMQELWQVKEETFYPMIRLLEFVIACGWGRNIMETEEKKRKYIQARDFVQKQKIQVPADEVKLALSGC